MNETTNAGRHAKGSATGQPGTIRGGQGASRGDGVGTGYNQKTGVAKDSPLRSMEGKPDSYFWTDAAQPSKSGEAIISASPTPFRAASALPVPGRVVFAEEPGTVPYGVATNPDSGPQVHGGGHAPMGKAAMEAAASVDGMPSSKGMNPINGGRASWMRKD